MQFSEAADCFRQGSKLPTIEELAILATFVLWAWLYFKRSKDSTRTLDWLVGLLIVQYVVFRHCRAQDTCQRLRWSLIFSLFTQSMAMVGGLAMGKTADELQIEAQALAALSSVGEETVKPEAAFLKPRIFPCRTVHTRYFPKKHSFGYKYLLIGVSVDTVGVTGVVSAGPLLKRRGWFHVDPADHLERQHRETLTLRQKLDNYLTTQHVDPRSYPHAYLVTAPRVLGYTFNPVSFWYLYNADKQLMSMILEVNNTFDERRMYLLQSQSSSKDSTSNNVKFGSIWAKDFHVSPFNDREGSYTLTSNDLWIGGRYGHISNDIELHTPSDELKLRARVFSIQPEIDPESLSSWSKLKLLVRWGGLGFVTFPRILREAWTLYVRRGLQVWFRPEVTRSSIARQPTRVERTLEPFFRSYLAHLVNRTIIPITYIPPKGMTEENNFTFTSRTFTSDDQESLVVRVISPEFYTRFVHYAHTAEAFDREFLCALEKNRTVWVSSPAMLHEVLSAQLPSKSESTASSQPASSTVCVQKLTTISRLRWRLLASLRAPPPAPTYTDETLAQSNPLATQKNIRHQGLSPLDAHTLRNDAGSEQYRRILTKLFLLRRLQLAIPGGALLFASPVLLDMADLLVRLCLGLLSLWMILAVSGLSLRGAVVDYSIGGHGGGARQALEALLMMAIVVVGGNAVHLWSLLVKGL